MHSTDKPLSPAAVLKKVEDGTIKGSDVIQAVITIAQVAEEEMGGTSGALYSCVFLQVVQLQIFAAVLCIIFAAFSFQPSLRVSR